MDQLEGHPFAEVLHHFRKRAHLTQTALAERIGAHRTTVSFWERGEYMPETLTMVLEIARVLQLAEADIRLLVEARFGTAAILPLHNLPEPNPSFTGRDALLEMLHQALTAGEQVALVQPQAISGLGGIGKTQLALAYAYRYRASYHDILWALAESRETLSASYVTFAEHLRLDLRAEHDQQKVVEAVKRWLRDHRGWLLILDNLEDLELVRTFVPTPRQGAVILTTRRAETSPVAHALALDVLSDEEGILFLLRRSGLLPPGVPLEKATSEQCVTARAIVVALGALPLALDQAGAYLAETRCSLSDYLALVQQERQALLHRRGSVPSDHPASVTTTFALAFEGVRQQNETASELLKLCAYLAPEAIPLDLFRQSGIDLGATLTPVVLAQPFTFNAALETLQVYSLVRREAEAQTLSLHRLVQAVQQAALPEHEQRRWAERAVRLVSAAFPAPEDFSTNIATWERCQHLVPHALLCAKHITHWGFPFPEAASLLHGIGLYLSHRAAYEDAQPLLHQALTLREQVQGPNHHLVTETLNALTLLYLAQGKYHDALPLLQRTLAIREQVLGETHPAVAECLHNLATLYWAWAQYESALPLLQRAVAIREQALGVTHPDVAQTLNVLAASYRGLGRYDQAFPLVQRALDIFEQTGGPTYPDVAWSLTNLARLYHCLGQDVVALPLVQRALAIREQVWGPDHPLVAQNLNQLADLYRAQGHCELALPLAERGLAIREQAVGLTHPDVAESLNTLAFIYQNQGCSEEALGFAQQALIIREQALGPAHPDVAESLITLTRLYEAQGQDTEALPLVQRALTIWQHALPDHPNTTTTQEHVVALLRRRESTAAASVEAPPGVNGTSSAQDERAPAESSRPR